MPEGPEILNAANQLQRVLVGNVLQEIYFRMARLKPFEACRVGTTVEAIETRGKAMLTKLNNGLTLYTHNELHGLWFVGERDRQPRTRRKLMAALHTQHHCALLFSAITINVLDDHGVRAHPFLNKLGPDVLAPGLSWRDIVTRLTSTEFNSRSLARLYLDQHFIAGIGNYLRSEILFFSHLHYSARPLDLSAAELERLARQTLAVAKRAYHTGGMTNAQAHIGRRQAAGEERRRNLRHAVFDRAVRPCDHCGQVIQRVDIDFRRLYFCPHCQPSKATGVDSIESHGSSGFQ
jgi:endonuclease-8